MLNLFFHTRCKQTRFCNRQCEKDLHTKEKSTEKVAENPVNPIETEDLKKKQIEAEMKRREKRQRKIIRSVKMFSSGAQPRNKEHMKWLEEARRSN